MGEVECCVWCCAALSVPGSELELWCPDGQPIPFLCFFFRAKYYKRLVINSSGLLCRLPIASSVALCCQLRLQLSLLPPSEL